jgi:hypothetical protein
MVHGLAILHVARLSRREITRTHRDAPSRQPSVSHSNVHLPSGDVVYAQTTLMFCFDLDGASSIKLITDSSFGR